MTIDYSGDGNGTISIASDENEGIDREQTLSVKNGRGLSADLTVRQEGLREPFNASDGNFLLSDGDTFNVLKK